MKKLFSKNGALTNKTMIVGVALVVVVALSYFGSGNYLNQSIMDMLMGGSGSGCKKQQNGCGSYSCPEGTSCPEYDAEKDECGSYTCSNNKPNCDAHGTGKTCCCGVLCNSSEGTCRTTSFYHEPEGEHTHVCYDRH